MKKKVLSILMTARNDGYHRNYCEKLEYVVNYYGYILNKLNLLNDVNLNIIDWGSKYPLHKKIKIYNNNFKSNINFYKVDLKLSNKLSKKIPGKFNHDLAMNLLAQRSDSFYCMVSPSDQIMSIDSLESLIKNLKKDIKNKEKILYLIPRIFISSQFIYKYPSFNILSNYLCYVNFSSLKYDSTKIHNAGGLGALVISKEMIKKISGLCYEGLPNFGWRSRSDNDLLRRSSYFCKHIDATSKGISMIKFPYDSEGQRKKIYNFTLKNYNFQSYEKFYPNKYKNWGRSKIKIKKFNPKIGVLNKIFFNKNTKESELTSDNKNIQSFFISTIKIGWHSLFSFEGKKSLFLALSIIEILKKLRIFRLIKLGEKSCFETSAISEIHNTVNLNINYISQLNNNFWEKLGSHLNHVHKGYFECYGDEFLEPVLKNLNEKCDNFESMISMKDTLKKKNTKLIIDTIIDNEKKFSILIFNNFSQKKIKSINQKFDLLFKYQDISIFINKKFLKENSRNTLINNIFLLKKNLTILYLLLRTTHLVKRFKIKLHKLIK